MPRCFVTFYHICKKALDDGNVCMALLTDLSKAFDCLPYRLLICKLRAYGLSVNACKLLKSYFCERKQRVKLGDKYSDWLGLSKGVPQGSLMGPFIFNIFSNDLLLLLEKKCDVLTMLTTQVIYEYIKIMILLIMICYQQLAQ